MHFTPLSYERETPRSGLSWSIRAKVPGSSASERWMHLWSSSLTFRLALSETWSGHFLEAYSQMLNSIDALSPFTVVISMLYTSEVAPYSSSLQNS